MNNSNSSNELPNQKTAKLLWQIISPILLLVGTEGSVLSIVVLTRKSMRKSNMSKYLTCLAVADLAVLLLGLLRQWVIHVFDEDIRDIDVAICKIHTWLLYSSLHASAWILVSVTIERTVFVYRPLRYRILCTKRVATLSVAIVVCMCLLLNFQFLLLMTHSENDSGVHVSNCSSTYEDFYDNVFPWIDMCVWCIVPVVVHLVCNILIIYRLRTHARTMSRLDSTPGAGGRRQRHIMSMTTMLLSLNLVYLLCTLPVSVFFVVEQRWEDLHPGEEGGATRELINACVMLVMYLNNATNFITCVAKASDIIGLSYRRRAAPTQINTST